MKRSLMNESLKSVGYSQEELYFQKDNQEKIQAIRREQKRLSLAPAASQSPDTQDSSQYSEWPRKKAA